MKKASLLGLILCLPLVLSACGGSEEEKLANLAADMVCLAEESMTKMMEMMDDPEGMEDYGMEVEERMNKMLADAGYENEAEAEDAYNNIQDKEAFKEMVKTKAEDKCSASGFLIEGFLSEMDS